MRQECYCRLLWCLGDADLAITSASDGDLISCLGAILAALRKVDLAHSLRLTFAIKGTGSVACHCTMAFTVYR